MKLVSVAHALPPHRVDQPAVTGALAGIWSGQDRNVDALARLHRAAGVETRYFVLPVESYVSPRTFTAANDLFISAGLDLCEAATTDALARAGLSPSDVDLVMMVSTSGLATPSLDARLANRLRFRPDVNRLPVFGLGCAGGAAGLARCADYLRGAPGNVALLVALELCSLTFQRDDRSTSGAVAAGLFGDAAAAAVLVGEGRAVADGRTAPRIVATRSLLYEDTEDALGWRFGERGFEVVLRTDVPDVVAHRLRADVVAFLATAGLALDDVDLWLVHPGGPRVLGRIGESLGLPPDALRRSREVLRRFGNTSSASVLLVLEETMAEAPAPGTLGLVVGMGPGFGVELDLLRWA